MTKNLSLRGFVHAGIVAIAVTILLIASLSYIYWHNITSNQAAKIKTNQNILDNNTEPELTPTKSASDTNASENKSTNSYDEYKSVPNITNSENEGYKIYRTSKYNISFEFPDTWNIKEYYFNDKSPYNQSAYVANANGDTLAEFTSWTAFGGTCGEQSDYSVLEVEKTNIVGTTYLANIEEPVTYSFSVIRNSDGTYGAHYGLTNIYTEVGNGQVCANTFYYDFYPQIDNFKQSISFSNNPISQKQFASIDAVTKYMDSDEYKQIKRMIMSLKY